MPIFSRVCASSSAREPDAKRFLAPPHAGRYEHADFAGGVASELEGGRHRVELTGSFGPPRIQRYFPGLLGPTWSQVIPRARTFRRLKVLTRREARVVEAVAETIFPADGTGMPTVQEAQVVEYFDDLLAHLELKERVLIRALVALLELQSLVFNGTRPRLFTRASQAERTKNLAGWETSAIFQRRLVFMAIRTILLFAYVDSQEVERDMGFVPGTNRTAERQAARQEAARRAIAQARGDAPLDERAGAPAAGRGLGQVLPRDLGTGWPRPAKEQA